MLTGSVRRNHFYKNKSSASCLSIIVFPLAVSNNKQPSSLPVYLTCSINHPSSLFFHEMFTIFLSLSSSTSLYHFSSSHEVSSDVFVKDGKAITLVIESQHSFVIKAWRFLGPHSSAQLKGIVRYFGKYAYLLSCKESDKKIDTYSQGQGQKRYNGLKHFH